MSLSAVVLTAGPVWAQAPAPVPAPARAPAAAPGAAGRGAVDPEAARLWVDFNHYVRIARYDMAQAAGTALIERLQGDNEKLLDVVEQSEYAGTYELTLQRAAHVETLQELSEQLGNRIQQGRIARSRERQRIEADIQRLAESERAQRNALVRLRAAGQFSAPALLDALLDERQQRVHPYVLQAMVSIGQPMVNPLCKALPQLEPVQQSQIAQVLGDIGYPRALPYLRQVIEDERTDAHVRSVAQAAFGQILQNTRISAADRSAAELFLWLGERYYESATRGDMPPGFDEAQKMGALWEYNRNTGLTYLLIPAPVYGDVLAMDTSRTALRLSPDLEPALSLWLAANLRRQNRLPAGQTDPSYGENMLPPRFYAEMAGPLRQHDVLARALDDGDPALALDAIRALDATAGTDALIHREGVQPLLRALSYPDRRVRIEAAFALTNARPKQAFPGSRRVVPVLSEAVRQSDARYAVAIARTPEAAQRLVGVLKDDLRVQAVGATTLNDADLVRAVNNSPGIDVIVTDLEFERIEVLLRDVASNFNLAATPIVVLASEGTAVKLTDRFGMRGRVVATAAEPDTATLAAAVEQAIGRGAGGPIAGDEAQAYALTALQLLREVAIGSGEVFRVAEAQPTLIRALQDERPAIVEQTAAVLSLVDDMDAQQAIAEAALDVARAEELRIALLGSLAESATLHGNLLNDVQRGKVLELVKRSRGALAIAAARTHGALTLPASHVVQLLVE